MNCYWKQDRTKLRNVFNNNMPTDLKLSEAQNISIWRIFMIIIKHISTSISESNSFSNKCFTPLGITAAASAIDAGIQKKIYGSGRTTLIISNE